MVLLVDRSDHEMIWLPNGEEILNQEKHRIQSPKLMPTFVWNLHGLQIVDAMRCQKERCSWLLTISEIFSPRSFRGVESGEK
jgi:hypothetical protein